MLLNRVKFNYTSPDTWNSYQTKMKEGLFSLSRESDPIRIDSTIEQWIKIAKNGNPMQLSSMLSVVEYFYPSKIHDSYFKTRIGYLLNELHNIDLSVKDNTVKEDSAKKSKYGLAGKEVKTSVKSKDNDSVTKVEVPRSKKVSNLGTDFPSFNTNGFPSCETSLFESMLATKKNLDVTKKDISTK